MPILQDSEEAWADRRHSDAKRTSGFFSVGRAFYDDEYESEDEDVAMRDTLDFSKPLSSIRRNEIQVLRETYSRVLHEVPATPTQSSNARAPSICIIRGLSGTGKSTLFSQFAEEITTGKETKGPPPYILKGKFEELSGENPLGTLVDAFASLPASMNSILETDKDKNDDLGTLRQQIVQKLGGQAAATELETMLPGLSPLLHSTTAKSKVTKSKLLEWKRRSSIDTTTASNDGEETFIRDETSGSVKDDKSQTKSTKSNVETIPDKNSNEHAWNRLKYMLQVMMQTICTSSDRPTILFLDDLQWADPGTLEVLELLLLDQTEMPNFMFVGAYRSDHALLDAYQQIMERATANGSNLSTVELENLTRDDMTVFLKHTLGMVEENYEDKEEADAEMKRVAEFAATLHDKTEGNIFFARQVLEELYSKGLLSFSRVTFTWEWDLDQIDVSDNVLEAVSQRIRTNCSEMLQTILITAAYMRNTVDADALMLVVDFDKYSKPNGATDFKPIKQQLIEELDNAVTSGFLSNVTGSNIYSFAHDRIRQAAYNMVAEGSVRDKFRTSIAMRLYRLSKDRRLGRDWMLLSATDHFNASPPTDTLFMASLNLRAGLRCLKVAAYESASKYLGCALENLGSKNDVWIYHYDLVQQIYSSKAEAELLLGNLEEGGTTAMVLFENAKSNDDKLRTQMQFAKALGRKKSHVESLKLSRKTLKSLKLYPQTTVGLITGLIRDLLYVKRYFQHHTDEEFLALPTPDNNRLSTIAELYCSCAYEAFFSGNVVEFLASCLKCIRFTIKNGIVPASAVMVMAYFMFCDNAGDHEGAIRFSNLGLKMLDKLSDKTNFCLILFLKTHMMNAWSTDVPPVVETLNHAYQKGLESGDFENAMLSRQSALDLQYAAGYSLALLDIQFAELIARMKVYNVGALQGSVMRCWNAIQYLRGTSDEGLTSPSELPFDAKSKLDLRTYEKNVISKLLNFRTALQMGVYWDDCDFLERLVPNRLSIQDRSHSQVALRQTFLALAYGKLYQRRKRRHSYLKEARCCLKDLQKISETKGKNSWHRYKLALAHVDACTKKSGQPWTKAASVIANFEAAMKLALDRKHKHDVALGAQLLVEHLLWTYEDPDRAVVSKYIYLAVKCYKEWGATNLVRHLEYKYSSFGAALSGHFGSVV